MVNNINPIYLDESLGSWSRNAVAAGMMALGAFGHNKPHYSYASDEGKYYIEPSTVQVHLDHSPEHKSKPEKVKRVHGKIDPPKTKTRVKVPFKQINI